MPGCPGDQALQKQVDDLTLRSTEQTKRIQTLESQLRSINNDMTQVKTLLTQVSNTVLAQKQAIEKLETATQARAASRPSAVKKSSGKKRR
jgi:archaellum component FlaC